MRKRVTSVMRHVLALAALCAGCAGPAAFAQSAAASAGPAVPVSTATATRQDVPLWLHGLGTVQAFNAVTVRARVDGTLMQVPVTEGQDVRQGAVLAVIDPRPYQAALDAAQAKRQQDQVQLANAQADLARYSSLARQDFASRQQVDTQQALVKQLTAALAGDAAQVEAAQLNLSYCYITAPFDGRVGLRGIDPGNLVHAADATGIMTLAQIHPVAVTFTLPQGQLPQVGAAMAQGRLPVAAFAEDDRTELARGELLTMDNAIDQATGTIKLKAAFANAGNPLWPGQFVHARLLLRTDRDVLTVPDTAVQHGADGLYVYVVQPNSRVIRKVVEVTRENAGVDVVAKGLAEGETVVTNGQSRLQDNALVTISRPPSTAAADAGRSGG